MKLKDFEFWGGAKSRAEMLTERELEIVENNIEEWFSDGASKYLVNGIFWFDFDTVAEWLGYEDEKDFDNKRRG